MRELVWATFRLLEIVLSPLHRALSSAFAIAPNRNYLYSPFGAPEFFSSAVTLAGALLALWRFYLLLAVTFFGLSALLATIGIANAARRSIARKLAPSGSRFVFLMEEVNPYIRFNKEADGVFRIVIAAERCMLVALIFVVSTFLYWIGFFALY